MFFRVPTSAALRGVGAADGPIAPPASLPARKDCLGRIQGVGGALRILLGTNQFQEIAGSERVIQEVTELFLSGGDEVVIGMNFVGRPMCRMAEHAGATTCLASIEINALEFDPVVVINQTARLLLFELSAAMRPSTRFVFMHVDLNFALSQPGLVHEPLLADEIWLHSAEAKDHFIREGLPAKKVRLFHIRRAAALLVCRA